MASNENNKNQSGPKKKIAFKGALSDSSHERLGCYLLNGEFLAGDNFHLVCRALFHSKSDVCIGASIVLGKHGDNRAMPYLLRALLTTERKKAEAFMWALGEIGDESAIPYLLSALKSNFVPKSAILALGKIKSLKAASIILSKINDEDESVRVLAARALFHLPFFLDIGLAKKAIEIFEKRLSIESSRRVRLMIALARKRIDQTIESV